ncbi:MAG TPA: phosphopyruvate hydratase [Candidatus Bathyarchaeia archaeon]
MPSLAYLVEKVQAKEILDSRGNPTVQVDVHTKSGFGRFSVPSGASKGRLEALELRDGDQDRFLGLGVLKAVDNVNRILGPAVVGMDTRNQEKIDAKLLKMDGTKNKSRLGSNALLGVSLAAVRAAADTAKLPLHQMMSKSRRPLLPLPLMNILNGGKHAGNNLSFQEFMILPAGFRSFGEALRCGSEIYHTLGQELRERYGKSSVNVGDEGGFAPPIGQVREALEMVESAVEEAGYSTGREAVLGIDAASGSSYDGRARKYSVDGRKMEAAELFDSYLDLCKAFPLRSIEDPFNDKDFANFARLTKRVGSKVQIIGDDLFVTNSARVEKGISLGSANALLVKVNQAGTLTETVDAVEKARKAGYGLVMSHRSGETEDTTIADLAVGLATGQIKTGAPARGERTAKYNRLLEIEGELGSDARFYGHEFLKSP